MTQRHTAWHHAAEKPNCGTAGGSRRALHAICANIQSASDNMMCSTTADGCERRGRAWEGREERLHSELVKSKLVHLCAAAFKNPPQKTTHPLRLIHSPERFGGKSWSGKVDGRQMTLVLNDMPTALFHKCSTQRGSFPTFAITHLLI